MNIPLKMSKQRLHQAKDLTEAHSPPETQARLSSRWRGLPGASAARPVHPAQGVCQRAELGVCFRVGPKKTNYNRIGTKIALLILISCLLTRLKWLLATLTYFLKSESLLRGGNFAKINGSGKNGQYFLHVLNNVHHKIVLDF